MNQDANSPSSRSTRSTSGLLYAILGAVIMTVFGWIPFVPVVGGAVSGYLEATQPDDRRSATSRGLRVGALAGLIATIPAALVIAFVASVFTAVFSFGAVAGPSPELSIGFGVLGLALVAVGLLALAAYHAGLGAVGGWLGAAIADDRGDAAASRRRADDHQSAQRVRDGPEAAESKAGWGAPSDGDDAADDDRR